MNNLSSAQGGLLQVVYGFCYSRGLFKHSWFQYIFAKAYFFYKKHIEDIYYPLLKKYPQLMGPGHVLDVGANIGYTSCLFANYVAPSFQVHAFEPAPLNFKILSEQSQGKPIRAQHLAVGARSGNIELWINPHHHGDHRVITQHLESARQDLLERVRVNLVSLDEYCEHQGIMNSVSFVKIDVQGPEFSVLQGMVEIINKNPSITISLEYDTAVWKEMGVGADEILSFLEERHFTIYAVSNKGHLVPTDRHFFKDENIQAFAKRAYVDIVATKVKNIL